MKAVDFETVVAERVVPRDPGAGDVPAVNRALRATRLWYPRI
jgi:hypothetical protein